MTKGILYATALDERGSLVHVGNAVKGMTYSCPVCKEPLVLRSSGKTGKGSRRPHFSHTELSPNCTPEGVLHYSFKKMLVDRLQTFRSAQAPFPISWCCTTCKHSYVENLLGRTESIREEFPLGLCRPDIALLDDHERVLVAIEIVVTHAPEDTTLGYYRENGIALVQINLESEKDLTKVDEIAQNPSFVGVCTNHCCINCDKQSSSTRAVVFQAVPCPRCGSPIEKYFIKFDSVFGRSVVSDFSDEEIELVKSTRTSIEVRVGEDQNRKFPVSVCQNCKRISSMFRSPRRRL